MESEPIFKRLIFAIATPSLEEVPSVNALAGQSDGQVNQSQFLDYHRAWTSLWSPRILGRLGFLPESRRCDRAGLDVENALVIVPEFSEGLLEQPLQEQLDIAGNRVIYTRSRPSQMIIEEIGRLIGGENVQDESSGEFPSEGFEDLEKDFQAFGFAVMQIQQMARKLRYSFNLDWMIVSDQIIQAAKNFNQGNCAESDRWLAAAFDSLSQERDRYCSQQGYLLHLVLSAPSTLGSRFTSQLKCSSPLSLLATTETLEKLRSSSPESFDSLVDRISQKSLCLVGGFARELIHTYLSEKSLIRSLQRSKAKSAELQVPAAKILAPFYPSIPAHLPSIAKLHGFQGVVLEKFLDGMIPEKEHAKLKWQSSSDSPAIDMVLGHLVDATDPESLLGLGAAMAKQLDYHQVPTLVLAHWPDRTCEIFQDLLRCIRRTPALGKWILADEYFQTTSQPYWSDQFGPQQFPFAIPKQPDKIHELQLSLIHLQRNLYGLERLADMLQSWILASQSQENQDALGPGVLLLTQIDNLLEQLDAQAAHGELKLQNHALWVGEFESRIKELRIKAEELLRGFLGSNLDWLVLNDSSHPRRLGVPLGNSTFALESQQSERVLSVSPFRSEPSESHVILDVPPMGFVRIEALAHSQVRSTPSGGFLKAFLGQSSRVSQKDGSLANEFIELQIDPKKGHLRSFYIRDQRGNRLSSMLSLCTKPAGEHHRISDTDWIQMTEIRIEHQDLSDSCGSVVTRGIFDFNTDPQGKHPWMEQTLTLQKGCKWVEVHLRGGGFDRGSCTPVWRTIWPSEAATLELWSQGTKSKWLGPLQANIELIEIDDAQYKIFYATGGLSYHIKQGSNQLQSLIPVAADGSIDVRFFIGLNWQRPWETAIDLFQTPWILPPATQAASSSKSPSKKLPSSGWLAQCNHANIRFSMLPCEKLLYQDGTQTLEPHWLIYLCEGGGKSSSAKISLPKSVRSAWKADLSGQLLDKIQAQGPDLMVPYAAWEKSIIAVVFET
ncbi:MAG: hypothetical protein ACOVOJ_12865 [Pirellula sp.]